MPFFLFDRYYMLLVLPAAIIAIWAQIRVKSTFSKYSRVNSMRNITGEMAARQILNENDLQNVRIEHVAGNLSDHYDPKANVIRLSDSVYQSTSVAAIGVAAHEAGHAVQYAKGYTPIKIRASLIPITQFGSAIGIPLAFVGLFVGVGWLIDIGIILFLAVVLFQLITLPVEFNASSRAISVLESSSILDGEELKGAKRVLSAAALTYVAALIMAIANILRLVLLRNRNNR